MVTRTKFTLPRYIASLGLFFIICLLITSYYLEYIVKLSPCPLCLVQRGVIVLIGLILLMQIIHNPAKRKTALIYGLLTTFFSMVGALVASRQIWLQHLPKDQVPPCGADLYTLMKIAPLKKVLGVLFSGSGDCAKLHLVFGLPLSQWSLISFLLLFICSIFIIIKSRR